MVLALGQECIRSSFTWKPAGSKVKGTALSLKPLLQVPPPPS